MNFGIWEGHYEYLDASGFSGRIVKFRASFKRYFLRRFSGVITDDSTNGVPEPAKINGWWRGRTVTFEKRYPHSWAIEESGKVVALDEWAQKTHGSPLVAAARRMHPPITCVGMLNDNDNAIMGVWHIASVYENLGSGGSIVIPEQYGTFAMRRIVERTYRPQSGSTRVA